MSNYVISLKDAQNRRRHIDNEFSKKQINYVFFDAITPEQALRYVEQKNLNYDPQALTATELACMVSHIILWEKIIEDDMSYMAIFEDDIHLGEGAEWFLNQHEWIQSDWHIIKLEAFAQRTLVGKSLGKLGDSDREILPLLDQNYGCAGYILTRTGAQVLLNYLSAFNPLIPLDHIVFEHLIHDKIETIYQLNPAICIQDSMLNGTHMNLPSALVDERFNRMKRNKKRGFDKIKLEIKRIFYQIKLALFAQNITFK